MTRDDTFIFLTNIARYRAMLEVDMKQDKRRTVERLLAEARGDLALAQEIKRQRQPVA